MENDTSFHVVKIYVMGIFTPFHVMKISTNLPNHKNGMISRTWAPKWSTERDDHEWCPVTLDANFFCIGCICRPRKYDGSYPHPSFSKIKKYNNCIFLIDSYQENIIIYKNKFVNTYMIMIREEHVIPSIGEKIDGDVHSTYDFISIR